MSVREVLLRPAPKVTDKCQSQVDNFFCLQIDPPRRRAICDLGASGQQYRVTAYVEFSPAPLHDDSSLKKQLPFIYMLSLIDLPPDNNPNQFQDVACYKQASVVDVQVLLDTGLPDILYQFES